MLSKVHSANLKALHPVLTSLTTTESRRQKAVDELNAALIILTLNQQSPIRLMLFAQQSCRRL